MVLAIPRVDIPPSTTRRRYRPIPLCHLLTSRHLCQCHRCIRTLHLKFHLQATSLTPHPVTHSHCRRAFPSVQTFSSLACPDNRCHRCIQYSPRNNRLHSTTHSSTALLTVLQAVTRKDHQTPRRSVAHQMVTLRNFNITVKHSPPRMTLNPKTLKA